MQQWRNFQAGSWMKEINVREFINKNFTVYEEDDSFLEGPTEATKQLWAQVMDLNKQEREAGGVLDLDEKLVSTITSHKPGYLNKELETVVGFQTDSPFKRSLQPFGGIRMAEQAANSYGFKVDEEVKEIFTKYRKTHNQGVFDAYTEEMRLARKAGVITGLPDAYGRGRIIGDYRRVALYGVEFLIKEKKKDLRNTSKIMSDETIRLREELNEQIRSLGELKEMAEAHGFD